MTVVRCYTCKGIIECSIYDNWTCDCGNSWWFTIVEYNQQELKDALKQLTKLRSSYGQTARDKIVVLSEELTRIDFKNHSSVENAVSLIDTLGHQLMKVFILTLLEGLESKVINDD